MSKNFPQLSYTKGLASSRTFGGDIFDVTFNGNFPDIARRRYGATLKIDGQKISSVANSTQEVSFTIPKSVLTFTPNKVTYKAITLNVPYRKNVFFFFKKKESALFNLQLVALPDNPGKIQIITTRNVDTRIVQQASCPGLIWDSSQDDIDKVDGCAMEDGWICDRNSVSYSLSREEGRKGKDWYDLGNASTSTYVGWHLKTLHKGFGTSGKLTVNITYSRYKTVSQSQTNPSDFTDLKWGDARVLSIDNSATWKLVFDQFDGRRLEFSSSNSTNPYIKIKTVGGQIEVTTAVN